MAKLTDMQLIVLSRAGARDDGIATVPEKLNKAAAAKVRSSLVTRKLMREVKSKLGMPVWREGDDGRPISLVITRAGRDAIGVGSTRGNASTTIVEKPAKQSAPTSKKTVSAKSGVTASVELASPRAGSKQALVIDMLSAKTGATLDALVDATGWLPHTTRAALTGLRKRGYTVERSRAEGKTSIYRIAKPADCAAAA